MKRNVSKEAEGEQEVRQWNLILQGSPALFLTFPPLFPEQKSNQILQYYK